MSRFLRIIRQGRWFKYPEVSWLGPGEAPGDALKDLGTDQGVLSVYKADDDAERLRVIAALAANRDDVDVLDFSWFDGSDFASSGITVMQQMGETPDTSVNLWHFDVVDLTATRVAHLADIVSTGVIDRVQKPCVKNLINKGLSSGYLDRGRMKQKLLQKLS